MFAQDVFYRTFFIYRLIWYDCNYICSKTCSKNWCTVVNFVSGSGSAGILSRNPSVGCHWNSIESLNTGIIFVAREYRFRVSVPGTSKIDQIAHFVSLRFCRFAKSFLTNLDELKHVRVIICVWILVQLKIGILQKKNSLITSEMIENVMESRVLIKKWRYMACYHVRNPNEILTRSNKMNFQDISPKLKF